MVRALALLAFALPAVAQYAGPAILTRGEAPAAMTGPQVKFRPFLEFTGVYDTGLSGVMVDSNGDLANASSAGVSITAGVSGSRAWKRTKIGLDYRGSTSHYTRKTYYDGFNQSLMLGITRQLTSHTSFSLSESAGLLSRNFNSFGLPQTVPFDPSTSYIPTTDFYDNRTLYLSSQANFTIQKSARLSFNMGGDGFLTRRRSSALYGVTGSGARGDVQYRLSRRSTIGAGYTYSHYEFTGIFSGTDIHGAVATYGIGITRTVEFSAYAGVLQAETKFLQSVPIDPAIAAIIGRSSGGVIVHRIDYMPNVNARLSKTFHRGVFYLSGGHSATPGNGLFLTSSVTTGNAGYTYTGLRHWSMSASAVYSHAKSIGNVLGYYGNIGGNFSGSRQITGALHAVANFSARQYQSGDFSRYNRLIYTATLGIGFTPGDIPLRVW
jgi:hypothetical protein